MSAARTGRYLRFSILDVSHSRSSKGGDGGTTGISHGGDVVFSDSDPTVIWGSAGGQIWRSSDGGDKWSRLRHMTLRDFVAEWERHVWRASRNEHCGSTKQRWQCQCSIWVDFDGGNLDMAEFALSRKADAINGTFEYGTNGKFLTSDSTGNYYLYDYNSTITAGGGLFKSSDGGATFTFVSAATTADKHSLSYHSANICYVFAIMPGHPNIMFYAPGAGYSPKAYAPTPLKVSFDSGLDTGEHSEHLLGVASRFREGEAGK